MTALVPRTDLGWRWQVFSGRQLLVTDGGGAHIVLAAAHQSFLQTRDPETGLIRNLDPDDQVAKIIATAPDVRRHAQALIHGIDIGEVVFDDRPNPELEIVLALLRTALTNSGAS